MITKIKGLDLSQEPRLFIYGRGSAIDTDRVISVRLDANFETEEPWLLVFHKDIQLAFKVSDLLGIKIEGCNKCVGFIDDRVVK